MAIDSLKGLLLLILLGYDIKRIIKNILEIFLLKKTLEIIFYSIKNNLFHKNCFYFLQKIYDIAKKPKINRIHNILGIKSDFKLFVDYRFAFFGGQFSRVSIIH